MPPQHASEASEAMLPKVGARAAPPRPHLVSSEFRQMLGEFELDGTDLPAHLGERTSSRALELPGSGRTIHAPARDRSVHGVCKRVLDLLGAILLGLIFGPLILTVALLLRREGGAIIYRHRRVGRDGKLFECLKFRSMVPNADRVLRDLLEKHPEMKAEWLRDHKLRCDPRITSLGRFLRRTSLDELPQLWNVLRGEMSLVGPRPIVREELMRYGRSISVYLSAKPGITGLWQVTGRNNTDYRRRVALDVYYVRKRSLLLDLYVLDKTPRVMLGGGGAY